ncbi:MAG: HepT-like ribonuclease domain-containing protein [Prolixibacteraceae bacterium]
MRDYHLDSQKRLQHISKAIDAIFKYVSGETPDTFSNNDLIHDAVLFQFSIIGEAVNFIESDLLDKYNYPWYKVRSFRNLISHEYFNIKMEAVWQIIEKDLPELRAVILSILKNEFGQPAELV